MDFLKIKSYCLQRYIHIGLGDILYHARLAVKKKKEDDDVWRWCPDSLFSRAKKKSSPGESFVSHA